MVAMVEIVLFWSLPEQRQPRLILFRLVPVFASPMAALASSSTAPILVVPRPAMVREYSKAAALLVLAAASQHHDLDSFAADLDGAEKGIRRAELDLQDMKRVTTGKDDVSRASEPLVSSPEAEQASATGANRYAGLQMAVDDLNRPEEEDDNKS